MKQNVYTLFDTKALIFNTPFYAHNHQVARRMVGDLVNDPNTSVGRHPADFVLYCLGSYQDDVGTFSLHEIREHVVDCIALVPPVRQTELELVAKEA